MDLRRLLELAEAGDVAALDRAVAAIVRTGARDLAVGAIDIDLAHDRRDRVASIRAVIGSTWAERRHPWGAHRLVSPPSPPDAAALRRVATLVGALALPVRIALVGHAVLANPAVSDTAKASIIDDAGGAPLPAAWLATSEVEAAPEDYPEWTEGLIEGVFGELGLTHTTWRVPLLGEAVDAAAREGRLGVALEAVLGAALESPHLFAHRPFDDGMRWLRETLATKFYMRRPGWTPWSSTWVAPAVQAWIRHAPAAARLEAALRARLVPGDRGAVRVWSRWSTHFDAVSDETLEAALRVGLGYGHEGAVWTALFAERERLSAASNAALDGAVAELARPLLRVSGLAEAVSDAMIARLHRSGPTTHDAAMLHHWASSHDTGVRLLAARPWSGCGDANPWPALARTHARLHDLGEGFGDDCVRCCFSSTYENAVVYSES